MKLRAWAAGTALAVATTFGGGVAFLALDTPVASAARPTTAPVSTQIPCSATSGGTQQLCTLTLNSLQLVNGALQAVVTITGTGIPTTTTTVPVLDPPATCPILSLTLGPLHLDLLGLVVDIPNPIVLNITATPGPGMLLGNLLCAVTNLLNNTGATSGLTALLNQINNLLAGL